MGKRGLRLEVQVVELDEAGNIVSTLCSHHAHYKSEDVDGRQDELFRYAYEGFDLARNKFDGFYDNQPDGL